MKNRIKFYGKKYLETSISMLLLKSLINTVIYSIMFFINFVVIIQYSNKNK